MGYPRYAGNSLLLLLTFVIAAPSAAQTNAGAVREALSDLEAEMGAVEATVSSDTGLVTFLTFAERRRSRIESADVRPAQERALAFLAEYGNAFGIDGRDLVARLPVAAPDEVGMEHVRLQQTYRGVPVTGGALTVHLEGGTVVAVNAKTVPDLAAVEVLPVLGPRLAENRARDILARRLGATELELSAPRLELFNRGLLAGFRGPTRLAWFVEATGPALREFVWVDAARGSLLLHFSQLSETRDRLVYDAEDPWDGVYNDLPGTLVRSEGDPPAVNPDANCAYDYSGDTYDYFWSEHGRDSFDEAGAALVSSVDFCPSAASCPYENAFWNGTQMVYGDGYPCADDVVAHELTHAVTEHSANLFYYMQSGALNESYSDIFGETVDLTNASGLDTPAVRWQIGEDLGAVRDMMDPNLFGDPGRMSDDEFVCALPGTDNGGVHTNSGVANHAYALMVDGGSYNGRTVAGIGLAKAGRIQYRALTRYLLSASDFLDNYNALNQACQDLIGTAGITPADCTEVGEALDAVEMYHPWPCRPAQPGVPFLCPLGGTASDLFYDDFENIASGNWRLQLLSGGIDHWGGGGGDDGLYWQGFASSGIWNFWGYSADAAGHSAVEMAVSVAIPAEGARAQFNHSYGFSAGSAPTDNSYYDGGLIEYSLDGGATWHNAGSLIVAGARYTKALSTLWDNPLEGRLAFVSDSFGYTATQLDLSALAGQNVRLRFIVATASAGSDLGWIIDDVRFYTCSGAQSLWDQTSFLASGGPNSQELEPSYAEYTCAAADDFEVPAGVLWALGGVHVPGHYGPRCTEPNCVPVLGHAPLVNIAILEDTGGIPGSSVCSYPGLKSGIDFSDSYGDLSLRLPTHCVLAPGTYWLSVVADMEWALRAGWYWTEQMVPSGHPYVWRNPGDGYGTGWTDWTPDTSPASNPDLGFSLWKATGLPAPPQDLHLSGETVSQAELYEACNSVTADDFEVVTPGDVTFRGGGWLAVGEGFEVGADSSFTAQLLRPAGCP